MLLATDLDGTFLGGDALHKQQLYQRITEASDFILVFVTGRGLQSVLSLYDEDDLLPMPAYMICDVGATVIDGYTLQHVEPIQTSINNKWPGNDVIQKEFLTVEGLTAQPVPQNNRCSFYYNINTDMAALEHVAKKLNVELIVSAGKFVDVLPHGVNKGTTLKALVQQLNTDSNSVMVAGDTFNDLALFNSGYKAVVVGNAEPGVFEATVNNPQIYHATAAGAGGILEAIQYFDGLVL